MRFLKIESRGTEVEIYGAETEEATFQIQTSAIAFQTLSAKLYSDTTKAVIRELCCNAYDAHVEVGKKSKPFEVNLPTLMNPEFIVRDFGPGMSDEHIMTLYCTYFSSSKQSTNKQIGGFGIGSKSPFSYTDGFTVISRQGGEKRTYSAYVNENKIPAVVRLSTEQTGEEDGLEVKFPVQVNDTTEFAKKAKEVFEFFEPCPKVNVLNFTPQKQTYTVDGKRWKIRSTDSSIQGVRVIQGMVPYAVHGMDGLELTEAEQNVLKMPLDIFLPIGTLSPAATRESLTNDKETTAKTRKILTDIHAEMIEHVKAKMVTFTTGWEMLSFLHQFDKENGFEHIASAARASIVKDVNLFMDEEIEQEDFPSLRVRVYEHGWSGVSMDELSHRWTLDDEGPFRDPEKLEFIVVDRHSGGDKQIREHVREKPRGLRVIAVFPRFTATKAADFDMQAHLGAADKFFDAVGKPKWVKLSDMPVPEKIKAARMAAPRETKRSTVWNPDGYSMTGLWRRTNTPLPKDGTQFYVRVTRGQISGVQPYMTRYGISKMMEKIMALNMPGVSPSTTIYAFTEKDSLPKKTEATWVNLFDYVKEKALEYAGDRKNRNITLYRAWELRNSCGLGEVMDAKVTHKLHPDSLFKMAIKLLNSEKPKEEKFTAALQHLTGTQEVKIKLTKLNVEEKTSAAEMMRRVERRYPLLRNAGKNVGSRAADLVVFYVNAIDHDQDWLARPEISFTQGEMR